MLFNNLVHQIGGGNWERSYYNAGKISGGDSFSVTLPNSPFLACVMMLSGSVGKYRGTAGSIMVYNLVKGNTTAESTSNAVGTQKYYASYYISGDKLVISNTSGDYIYPEVYIFTSNG